MRWPMLLVIATACGNGRTERNDKPAEQGPMRSVQLPEPAIALPRELAFELLEAGGTERAPLRYTFAAASATLDTSTELTSRELVGDQWREPVELPAITTQLEITLAADGKATLQPLAGHAEGSAAAAQEYLAPWQALAGKAFVVTLDARGRLLDHGTSPDELLQRLFVAFVPLPEEPIGIGGRWRVVTAFRQSGAVLKQTATYTLLSRAPLQVGVDIQQLAERQQLANVELVAIVRKLSGTIDLDPARPVAARGSLDVTSTVHVRASGGEHITEDSGVVKLVTRVSSTSK